MPVTFASFEARGSFTDRGIAAEDADRTGEGLRQKIEVSYAPGKTSPGEEELDLQLAGGEVIDDYDVVDLCQSLCKV